MTEEKRKFMRERVNLRCFYLRLLKKLRVLPLGALLGAVCGFLLYAGVTKLTRPVLYEAKGRLYVHYREHAEQELIYNNYNAFTWRDLLETEAVRRHLSEEDTVREAEEAFRSTLSTDTDPASLYDAALDARADLTGREPESFDVNVYSDIRILHITGISHSPEVAAYRVMLYTTALMRYAEEDEVITGTELLGYAQPEERSYPERRTVAIIAGAIVGLLLAAFLLWIRFLFDNAVYVPEDASRRYGIPVLAVLPRAGSAAESYLPQFKEELQYHVRELQVIGNKWLILKAQDTDVTNAGASSAAILREYAGEALGADVIISEKTTAKVNTADVILLEVSTGKRLGERYEHLIAEAAAGGKAVKGIILTDADNTFLKQYYRM